MSWTFWDNQTCRNLHDWKKMKKVVILIPVYNDWESLAKLIEEIDIVIQNIKEIKFDCLIINDASSIATPRLDVPKHIASLKVINMKRNQGHARCNAFGIRYLAKSSEYDRVILMDGDGEDRPQEIKLLIDKALSNKEISVVAKRIKRSEGFFFQFLYQIHKILTIIFTGKNINFGNYSCLTPVDVTILSNKKSLWSSFSGSLKYHVHQLNTIDSIRGIRYFGPSKMSFLKLVIHSFAIISVFKKTVFLRSVFIIILLSYIQLMTGYNFAIILFLIAFFNLLIFLVSLRENENDLNNSDSNEKSSERFTH